MQPNAVQAVTARLVASLAGLALLTAPAFAGDAAQFQPLGFSEDGRYFAFEEYGIQDGSGFPYANITILDTAADKWAAGSPFRIRLEDDTAALTDARDAARTQAEPHLEALALTAPVLTVALNGDGEAAGHFGDTRLV